MNLILLFLISLLFSSFVSGETYEYELKGTYKRETSSARPIKYTLKWSEDDGDIRGTYSDNYFAQEAQVSGKGSSLGKTFVIELPKVKSGIRSLTALSGLKEAGKTATTIPVSFITRDKLGNPLTTTKSDALFAVLNLGKVQAEKQEEESSESSECGSDFGALEGYCGLYSGEFSEEVDRRNKCNLLFADAVKLELSPSGMVYLHLGEVNDFIQTKGHTIGRILAEPTSPKIDLVSRYCGPLSGVNSIGDTCKRIHLEGDFFRDGDIRRFKGEYTISEEGSNMNCRYRLNMDQ